MFVVADQDGSRTFTLGQFREAYEEWVEIGSPAQGFYYTDIDGRIQIR